MSDITLDDFKKIELKTARVLEAEEIAGADRIWKLMVDAGSGPKQIVAGIKAFYTKEQLIGKTVIVVDNLAPAVIRGVESRGMLLAAKDENGLAVVSVDRVVAPGSRVG